MVDEAVLSAVRRYLAALPSVGIHPRRAVLFGSFARGGAQVVMRRYYGPLIRRMPRHRTMLYFWFLLYAFVGIEMGWVLRPFIGDPKAPVEFLRSDAWGNAYVVVAQLVARVLHSSMP
jgi:hypothetical protein